MHELLDELRVRSLKPERQIRKSSNLPPSWHQNPKAAHGLRDAFHISLGDNTLDRGVTSRGANFGSVGSEINFVHREGYTCACDGDAVGVERREPRQVQ